jgi:hypothetical protein
MHVLGEGLVDPVPGIVGLVSKEENQYVFVPSFNGVCE